MVKRVTYNGVEMVEGWPERIIEAQTLREYVINGSAYARIPYGSESGDWDAEHLPCHDCRVLKGPRWNPALRRPQSLPAAIAGGSRVSVADRLHEVPNQQERRFGRADERTCKDSPGRRYPD